MASGIRQRTFMAESLAHRWEQIIGDGFEMFVCSILVEVATAHNLYLDSKGPREARSGHRKVTWPDDYGNKHDLDYVLERGGTEQKIGVPAAFIESAWRRYTKHRRGIYGACPGSVGIERLRGPAHSLRLHSGRVPRTRD